APAGRLTCGSATAPGGMALMPSPDPPVAPAPGVGPKPTKDWLPRTPNFLAGIMWPSSCSPTDTSTPSRRTSTPTMCGTMLTPRDYVTPLTARKATGPTSPPRAPDVHGPAPHKDIRSRIG